MAFQGTEGQVKAAQYLDWVNKTYANPLDYSGLDVQSVALASQEMQELMNAPEGTAEARKFNDEYARRSAMAQSAEGRKQLAQEDTDQIKQYAKDSVKWWDENPNGTMTSGFGKFMSTVFPGIVLGGMGAAATGLLGGGGLFGDAAAASGAAGSNGVTGGLSGLFDIPTTIPLDTSALTDLGWMNSIGVGDAAAGLGAAAGNLPVTPMDAGNLPLPSSVTDLPTIVNGNDMQLIPDEFFDNASNAYDAQSNYLPSMTANDFSTGGSSLLNNLQTIKDIGKPIVDVLGSINDRNNANNAASNAQGQIQSLLDAQKAAQARSDAYVGKLDQAYNAATAANTGYLNDLKGLYTSTNNNNTNLLNNLNGLYNDTKNNNTNYLGQMNALADQIKAANDAYVAQQKARASEISGRDKAYVGRYDQLANDSIAANKEYTKTLSSMYAPGTPEHEYFKQQMEAKDAATGRRSQYGTRAVDLAAQMALQRAGIMTSAAYTRAMDNKNAQEIWGSQGYLDALHDKAASEILGSAGMQNALNQTGVSNILTSGAYKDALNNTGALNILNSGAYQNAVNNTGAANILNSSGYQNAVNNTAANNILTSGAYANTVNNSSLMNLLTNPQYVGLNNQMTQANGQKNNSTLSTLGNLFSTGDTLSKAWKGISSLFGG